MAKTVSSGAATKTLQLRLKDKHSGFLRQQAWAGVKLVSGVQTGYRVCAAVPKGKKSGSYTGRVAVRASGSFHIQCKDAVVQGVGHKHCKLIQRSDGYGYSRIATYKGEAR